MTGETVEAVWVAVCLPCWRRVFRWTGAIGQPGEGDSNERCVFCQAATRHGVYVEAIEELPRPRRNGP
jgi:hypothetical protein